MFRMTMLTVFSLFRIEPAVIAHALFDILGDITMIMTRETALYLVSLFQCLMATLALLLKLGMTGNHRARHKDEI
jgi:hypothetical protein